MTGASDGTTTKGVNIEASNLTIPTPSYDPQYDPSGGPQHSVRALPTEVATGHTSEEQGGGWVGRGTDILETYNESPLGRDAPLTESELWGKFKGFLSDHANDQKKLFSILEDWKRRVDRDARGRAYLDSLPPMEVFDFFVRNAQRCMADIGGADKWDLLSDSDKQRLQAESTATAIQELGEEHFNALSEVEKRWGDLFIWGGCDMHKAMNSEKWGATFMEAWWTSVMAQKMGAEADTPMWLFNKANAAAVADETASSSKELAKQSTKRGGVKTTDLAGGIFHHKYHKKGQQDNFRWYFAAILGYMIQFPDTSNTHFGSHGMAATELLTHLSIYLEFLEIVRRVKDAGTFNNMEKNLYSALQDCGTLSELVVLALYSQTVTIPYLLYRIADSPEILLGNDAPSTSAILDGGQWERPEICYTIHRLDQAGELPHLHPLITAFFAGAVHRWGHFTTEFAPGGRVDLATPAELDAAHMRPTNDVCEGTLGSTIRAKARSPAKTLRMINASAVHKQNNTEAFKAAHTTEEIEKFVRRKAREEDTGHALQEVRAEHAWVQKEKSERKEASRKARKAKRTARDNILEQLEIHLEPAFWDNLTASRQPTVKDISLQLSWLRVPSRGVKVPVGLSKGRRADLVQALVEVLRGLDEDKVTLLYAQNVAEPANNALAVPLGTPLVNINLDDPPIIIGDSADEREQSEPVRVPGQSNKRHRGPSISSDPRSTLSGDEDDIEEDPKTRRTKKSKRRAVIDEDVERDVVVPAINEDAARPKALKTADILQFFKDTFSKRTAKGTTCAHRTCKICRADLVDQHTTLWRHCEAKHKAIYRKWAKAADFTSKLPGDIAKVKKMASAIQADRLQQKTLDHDLKELPERERVQAYSHRVFREAAIEWFIATDQIGHVTTDNASNNRTMLYAFANHYKTKTGKTWNVKLRHVGCIAHIINLATQALITTYSKSPHFDPANPTSHEPEVNTNDSDVDAPDGLLSAGEHTQQWENSWERGTT
ncbi:hypothetical protein EUX98_g9475 [Antrodiella citrinella]|uniref:Uncharacterized protein n=1 Tax=Antrodiella citrinella TaxID=2447956 RepID=A0A4S4LSJ9_9APHY|nr:hypothetical protein EUX98_g9475 [Antrodiella citrinella]